MTQPPNTSLDQLLRRNDIWRGTSAHGSGQTVAGAHWDTGHDQLNQALLLQGWPLGQLIEICQPQALYSEWLLWGEAVARCTQQDQIVALLNPPAMPLLSSLTKFALTPANLWIVKAPQRQDFVPTLTELLKASCIAGVLAWEPQRPLSYTDLRKIQLANLQSDHACCLFRTHKQRQHSSPAALRLWVQLQAHDLMVEIFKQKGHLQSHSLKLSLPRHWCGHWQAPEQQHKSPSASVTAFPFQHKHL